jgi:hypothetical protein
MKDVSEQEVIELDDNMDVEAFNEFAREQGWSDGMPLFVPTEAKVAKFVETVRGDNRPYAPVPPRQVIPTIQALAANAVMAGCKPEYFPVATAAMRAVLDPEFNLHGTLATTHSCAPMVMVSGPIRKEININCSSNCFGQGWQANATIGRALGLMLLNVAGAKPGEMDRSTQGNPAKFTFCFGENEEENPWIPYHVQRGFAPSDSVVTVMSGEGPHNLNDHGSTTGDGLLTTFAGGMSNPGANTIYGKGPMFVVIGPEHAATLKRDGYTIDSIRQELWKRSRVHLSRVSKENLDTYASTGHKPDGDWLTIGRDPSDIHITVAGGPGKHSAFIPSFGGTTVSSVRIAR